MRHKDIGEGAEFTKVYEVDAAEAFAEVDRFRKVISADMYLIADSYKNGSFGDIAGLKFQIESQEDPNETFQIATDQLAALKGLSLIKNLRTVYMDSIAQNLHYMHTILTNPSALVDASSEDISDHIFEMTDVIYQEYIHTLDDERSIKLTVTSAKTDTGNAIMLAETVDAAGKAVAIFFENGKLVYLNHYYKSDMPSEFEDFTKALIEAELPPELIYTVLDFIMNNVRLESEALVEQILAQTDGKVDIAAIRSFALAMSLKFKNLTDAALFSEEIGEIESNLEEIRQVKLVASLLGIIYSGDEE